MKYNMPKVDLSQLDLTDAELEIASLVVKKNGAIRATKPKVEREDDPISGKAAYVWREVVFCVSQKPAHQCMPVTAEFDLPAFDENGKWSSKVAREMGKELKVLIDKIVNSVPKNEWHGINRWGRAFGYTN